MREALTRVWVVVVLTGRATLLVSIPRRVGRWLLVGGADGPEFVRLPRAREIRELEWQQEIDQQSAVTRRSWECRARERRRVSGLVERVRGRV